MVGVLGSLETSVAAESTSELTLHSPPSQAYLSRTDRDDQHITHPSPFGLSSPVVSSKQPSDTRSLEVSKRRRGARRNRL